MVAKGLRDRLKRLEGAGPPIDGFETFTKKWLRETNLEQTRALVRCPDLGDDVPIDHALLAEAFRTLGIADVPNLDALVLFEGDAAPELIAGACKASDMTEAQRERLNEVEYGEIKVLHVFTGCGPIGFHVLDRAEVIERSIRPWVDKELIGAHWLYAPAMRFMERSDDIRSGKYALPEEAAHDG